MITKDIAYGDHPDQKLDLYYAGEDAPLFVFFHGGGLEAGSKGDGNLREYKELMADGISAAVANYRMYPAAKFPDFLEDAARCAAWCKKNVKHKELYIGGSSAGGYMTQMLAMDPKYLGAHGLNCADKADIAGYFCDSGQPTVHFNVLRERGEDTRLVRLDEAAPIWHVKQVTDAQRLPRYALIVSDNDMVNRLEQNQLFYRTMLHFGYPEEKVSFTLMEGFSHTGYCGVFREDGTSLYAQMIRRFIRGELPLA